MSRWESGPRGRKRRSCDVPTAFTAPQAPAVGSQLIHAGPHVSSRGQPPAHRDATSLQPCQESAILNVTPAIGTNTAASEPSPQPPSLPTPSVSCYLCSLAPLALDGSPSPALLLKARGPASPTLQNISGAPGGPGDPQRVTATQPLELVCKVRGPGGTSRPPPDPGAVSLKAGLHGHPFPQGAQKQPHPSPVPALLQTNVPVLKPSPKRDAALHVSSQTQVIGSNSEAVPLAWPGLLALESHPASTQLLLASASWPSPPPSTQRSQPKASQLAEVTVVTARRT